MDFDHLLGVNKFNNLSSMISRGCGLEAILEEIKKCEVVCACCHRLRTKRRRGCGVSASMSGLQPEGAG